MSMSEQDIATARTHHVFTETVEAARNLGDPLSVMNEGFWQIASNIICSAHGNRNASFNYAGPEMAELVAVAKAVADSSTYMDWAGAAGVCDRLFEDLDGGDELGLSVEWCEVDDWNDTAQREKALRQGMAFHRVPKGFQARLAQVVTRLMMAMPNSWNYEGAQLHQPWAQCITYVVFAVAERVKAVDAARPTVDGNHRGIGFH